MRVVAVLVPAIGLLFFVFFFSSRRRHTRWTGDWSSDVCSSDLNVYQGGYMKTGLSILVTGGAGFIGSNFIKYILSKYPNYEIINLDKLTYAGSISNLESVQRSEERRVGKECRSQWSTYH